MSDLVTEEIEAVMRETAEREGENHLRPGWKIEAFGRAFADPEIKRLAAARALQRYERLQVPPEPDQRELFQGEDAIAPARKTRNTLHAREADQSRMATLGDAGRAGARGAG